MKTGLFALFVLLLTTACIEGETECFDADYPIEPTFDTPEEALEDALEAHPEVSEPGDIDEYQEIERSEDSLEFEYRESDNVHHTWGITRDEDGKWGMTSLGGCFDDDPFS